MDPRCIAIGKLYCNLGSVVGLVLYCKRRLVGLELYCNRGVVLQ